MPARSRTKLLALGGAVVLAVGVASALPAAAASPAGSIPQVVPKPVSMTEGHGHFNLTARSRIVASSSARAVGVDLARYLRPATGYRLPVVVGTAHHGDIALTLGKPTQLSPDRTGEGYVLDASSSEVSVRATTAHGLFDGVQTIRQLLPVWIESSSRQAGPWTIPNVHIVDYPRYAYRGVMLDIARHYQTPRAVMRLIDQVSAYKINTLHLHVSDDQGFRIVINGFPRLTRIGGAGSVGTHGRTVDPGGYWTQSDYRSVVAYAAAHYMAVVPEVDSPGHNNAIIMSEYNDIANPRLDGHPHNINCSVHHPPMWDYTANGGYTAMCPESSNSFAIYRAIIKQLAAMSSSRYYDIGGDEVPTTLLSQARYAKFVNTEMPIVRAQDKLVMGWADLASPGTHPPAGSVAEYWNPASGSDPNTFSAHQAVAKHMKVVMAPGNHAFLDQKYLSGAKGNVPPTMGMNWACPTGCDVDQYYNWDPGNYVTGVTDRNVIGLEGTMFGETVVDLSNIDYMVFPRLIALAEVGWSPLVTRTATSPAYQDFLTRLASQGTRLTLRGTNFYPSAEVPWRLDLNPAHIQLSGGHVTGTLAWLSAPGVAASDVAASVKWGDGTTSSAVVSGNAATSTTVNGLYRVKGTHEYSHPGTFRATITTTHGSDTAVVHTTIHWSR